MIEVHPKLFVGNKEDFERLVKGKEDWFVVQACKDPYHKQALGYTGRAASKDHPEYLWAVRENRLILNLVDADDPKYFSIELMDNAVESIHKALSSDKHVLVHCNQGMSRSPGIALLYLLTINIIKEVDFIATENAFVSKHYPGFQPGGGVRGYLMQNWQTYQGRYV